MQHQMETHKKLSRACLALFIFAFALGSCSSKEKESTVADKYGSQSGLSNSKLQSLSPSLRLRGLNEACKESQKNCGALSQEYINDPDKRIRIQAFINLAQLKHSPALDPALKHLPKADTEELQYIAAFFNALGGQGFEKLSSHLLRVPDDEKSGYYRILPMMLDEFVDYMQKRLANEPEQKHHEIYRIIGLTESPKGTPIFLNLLQSDSLGGLASEYLPKIKDKNIVVEVNRLLRQELVRRKSSIIILRLIEILGKIGNSDSAEILSEMHNHPVKMIAESSQKALFRITNKL